MNYKISAERKKDGKMFYVTRVGFMIEDGWDLDVYWDDAYIFDNKEVGGMEFKLSTFWWAEDYRFESVEVDEDGNKIEKREVYP